MVQMGAVVSWQNSFHRYYHVCGQLVKYGLSDDDYPLLDYYHEACDSFGVNDQGSEYAGGPHPRFSPTGFNFRDVFGLRDPRLPCEPEEEDSVRVQETQRRVDLLTDILLRLLNSINNLAGDGARPIPRVDLQRLVLQANDEAKVGLRCELGEFRLLIFLQFCATMCIVLKTGRYLRYLLYPVEGAASFENILKHGFKKEDVDEVCQLLMYELEGPAFPLHMDQLETMLCESTIGRMLTKTDVYIRFQSLFRLDDDGVPWMKKYGSVTWQRAVRKFSYE
jgi:hypothetical protein